MSFLTYIFVGTLVYCLNVIISNKSNKKIKNKEDLIATIYDDYIKRFADPNDYYTILGVTKNASNAEIKEKYDNLLLIYNTNTFEYLFGNNNTINNSLHTVVKFINTAYSTLCNKTERYYYDNKDIIANNTEPDDMINQLIDGFADGVVDDFDPNDKTSYWNHDELNR